jgi:hypothetical protein
VLSPDGLYAWQFCYGISEIPDQGDKWFCARCAAADEDAQCVLCPMPSGALKPVLKERRSNKYFVRVVYVWVRRMCASLSCMCVGICEDLKAQDADRDA